MAKKTITRAANSRGLDRMALASAKAKAGMIGVKSFGTLSGADREKRLTNGLNLLSEASALQLQSSKIRSNALKASRVKK